MDADAVEDIAESGPVAQGEESDGEVLLTTSFGIVLDEFYDPIRHVGEDVVRYHKDGRRRAIDQIKWLLLKGQMIPQTGVQHIFAGVFGMGDLEEPMRSEIVTSDLPCANLPKSLKHDGARALYRLEWQRDEKMESVSKVKNRRFYSTKPKYWKAKVIVRLGFDPRTRTLSVTPLLSDGTASPGSRVIWLDPDNLDDGCSVISMPPPMYSLMRPESYASSIFRRFARVGSRDDDETEETESDPPASGTRSGD